ncbi:MAG: RNA polymerase sigma24 factor [Candidatus Parcubacteria bacterium]|nr:MAG: RNA polymerase sigma24 factor [Candidatus Parcubacteria bacterium]
MRRFKAHTASRYRAADDARLAAEALRNKEAFGELYRRYAPRVEQFALRLTRDRDAARDITQETFLRAYRALARYRPRVPFAHWLFVIARNLLVSRARREARFAALSEAPDVPAPQSIPNEVEQLWALQRLAAAVRRLRPRERALLRAFYLEGKPLRAIASEWGTTENAVKLLLSRTRGKVRRMLSGRQ